MAINFFNGDVSENLDAALNEEISYPKTLVSYNNGAEVWVYNGDDQPPSDEQIAERGGVKTFYQYDTRE